MLCHSKGVPHTQAIYMPTCHRSFLLHTVGSCSDLHWRLPSMLTALHDHKGSTNMWGLKWRRSETFELSDIICASRSFKKLFIEPTFIYFLCNFWLWFCCKPSNFQCLIQQPVSFSHESKLKSLLLELCHTGTAPPSVRSSLARPRGHCSGGLNAARAHLQMYSTACMSSVRERECEGGKQWEK